MLIRTASFLVMAALGWGSFGCGKVKQKAPPRIPDDAPGSADISEPESDDPVPVEDDAPEETPEQKKKKCWQECVDSLPDDKSGDPPGALSCTMLTSKMGAGCIVWFDKHPTTAKEAQEGLDAEAAAGGG